MIIKILCMKGGGLFLDQNIFCSIAEDNDKGIYNMYIIKIFRNSLTFVIWLINFLSAESC